MYWEKAISRKFAIGLKKPLIVAVDSSNYFKQPHHITHTRIYSLKIRMTTSFIKHFMRIASQR